MVRPASNVQEAGDASRWQHEGDNEPTGEKMENGGYVELESGIPAETQRELKKRGHDVRLDVGGYGGYQAIKVEMHDGVRVYRPDVARSTFELKPSGLAEGGARGEGRVPLDGPPVTNFG